MLAIIVAMDNNNLIGANNELPWHLPADLQYFKKTTTSKTVVMGHKTYLSIGKPLPNRENIILSRNNNLQIDGCKVINNLKDIKNYEGDIFIIGGANIYMQMIDLVDKLYITKINYEFSGDAYFPEINNKWNLESEEKHNPDEKNKYEYSFQIYSR